MGKSGLISICCLSLLTSAHLSFGKAQSDKDGDQKLADKLLKLSQSLDMKESRYPDSKGGGKDFNANDGNSFTSNTTYHTKVWSVCENWLGPTQCARWIDPYVSEHGKDGDRSPLEGAVWEEYQGARGAKGGNQYAIWQVASKGGNIVDIDGKLDREQLAKFKLLPKVTQKVQQVGRDTAQRQINLTKDPDDKQDENNTMPNMESLRMMASRWTKMFRNRLVSNIGELRAADRPIEFGLSEDAPDCDSYLGAMRREQDRFRLEERLDKQGRQQIETRQLTLERRYNLCQQMRQKDVYAVNPTAIGNEILETGPQNEQVDKWRSRVNIALVDYVGMDVNSVPKPNQQIEEDEYKQEMSEFGPGGMEGGTKRMTNAEQLDGYNQALEEAARGMQEVAARSPQIRDTSADILKYRIARGSRNMVDINSLTNEMRTTLGDTGLPRVNDNERGPETDLERKPAELTVTKR